MAQADNDLVTGRNVTTRMIQIKREKGIREGDEAEEFNT
jgi:hypothetical protein